ncbi:MAG: terpene cyclase/mutase family protein [Phycisphaerae bacterium]|nr:terpene cyclase/mutase family protein [Phycisphaerae bacterium]
MKNVLIKSVVVVSALLVALAGCSRSEDEDKQPTTKPAEITLPTTLPSSANDAIDADYLAKAQKGINAGIGFLLEQRNSDGGWGSPGRSHPAMTAMAIKAMLQHPEYDNESPIVSDGFKCLMRFRQSDGGFYVPGQGNKNYITSVAVMALATAKNPAHKTILSNAVKFLRGQQIVPGSKTPTGQEVDETHPYVGGVSYGGKDESGKDKNRPDLSNVGMWMDALHEAGVPADDPAMQRALAFVTRLQNRTEGTEGQVFVVSGTDDGGFIYAVNRKDGQFVGESKAKAGRRGLRSYGSMTYIGFKSMLYADVARNDPRVQAAYEWIRKYWRLDSNPNMPEAQSKQGLFYYYHVFAKALHAWGQDEIPDSGGVKHNWREELIDVLAVQQNEDGSWVNKDSPRWMEGNPVLATCFAVLALEETLK